MFEKLKGIFSKKPKPEEEPVRGKKLTVSQSRERFLKATDELEKQELLQINSTTEKISQSFESIQNYLDELKSLEMPEKRAHASRVIKDKWVERTETVIGNLLASNREIASIKDLEKYIASVDKTMESVKISPIEAGHIKFFFPDSLAKISKSTNEIIASTNELKSRIQTGFAMKFNKLNSLYDKIDETEKKISLNSSELEKLEYEISEYHRKLLELEPVDVSEIETVNQKIKELDIARRKIYQRIDSLFGSITRYLRKFEHKNQNKLENHIINEYLENSHKAFINDETNRIRDILLKLIIFVKDERIEMENRSIQKIEDVLSEIDNLSEEKKVINDISDEIKELENRLETDLLPREEKNRQNERQKLHIEKVIQKNELEIKNLTNQNASLTEHIATVKKDIGKKLYDFTKEELIIE